MQEVALETVSPPSFPALEALLRLQDRLLRVSRLALPDPDIDEVRDVTRRAGGGRRTIGFGKYVPACGQLRIG